MTISRHDITALFYFSFCFFPDFSSKILQKIQTTLSTFFIMPLPAIKKQAILLIKFCYFIGNHEYLLYIYLKEEI